MFGIPLYLISLIIVVLGIAVLLRLAKGAEIGGVIWKKGLD